MPVLSLIEANTHIPYVIVLTGVILLARRNVGDCKNVRTQLHYAIIDIML